jgi:hypothetical protein
MSSSKIVYFNHLLLDVGNNISALALGVSEGDDRNPVSGGKTGLPYHKRYIVNKETWSYRWGFNHD